MLTKEQLKQSAKDFLEGDITGEEMIERIVESFASNTDADIAAKWLAEQILIAR